MDNIETSALLPRANSKKSSRFLSFFQIVWECTTKLEKFLFVLGVLSAIATGLTQPFMSYTFAETSTVFVEITSALNNRTIDPEDLEKAYENFSNGIGTVVLHFTLCGIAFFTFGFIQVSLLKYVGDNTTYRLRTKFISRLLHKDAEFFDTTSTGYLSTILNDNLERFRESFNEKIAFIICFTSEFFIGTFLAFSADWKLASYGSIFAFGIAFSGVINTSSLMKSTESQNKHYANAGSIAFQALGSLKTVISLNGQAQELEKYTSELRAGEKHGSNRAFSLSTARSLSHFFCNALNGIILYIGADLIYSKTLDQTTIVVIFHYMLFSAFSLSQAFPEISYFANAISSVGPIADILNSDDNKIERDDEDHDESEVIGKISFKDVIFSYPTRPDTKVLKGISFDVNNGECIALVGASGSGKSTVVQLLLHYYNHTFGDILIDGVKIGDISLKKLRRSIGVVSQEPILFNATIEDNIRFGKPNATLPEIYEALRKANAYNFVCSFPKGLHTVVGERGAQLSGGQKQRIAIARVLVRNPKILLLDEATSALDNESERAVHVALENASQGRTTIVIAHRLSTIRNCHKIMVMENGKIVEVGNHKELIEKSGVYKDLIQAQLLDSQEHEDDYHEHTDDKETEIEHKLSYDESVATDDTENNDMKRLRAEMEAEGVMPASIRDILRCCREDYCVLIIAVIGSALQGFCFPIIAQLIVRCYEAYSMEGEDILIYGHFWASMFFVLGVLRPISFYCQLYCFGNVSERLSTRLRIRSFKHLLSLPCAFYDDPRHSATKLSNRLNTDASNIKAAVDARLGNVLMTTVSLLVAISTATYYCWEITIQVLLFFPVLYLAKYYYEKKTVLVVKQDSKAFEESNKIAVEALENAKTVRSLNIEDEVMKMVFQQISPLKKSYTRRALVQGLTSGFSVSCSQLLYAISFKFGAWLILKKEAIPMNMYLALITLSFTSNMAGSAITYLPDYKKALHAAGLIFKLFTYPATMTFDATAGRKNIRNGEIVGENLQFHYKQRPDHLILAGLNLKVETNKTLALVGPSGSGKSTIISLLERFYDVFDGELNIDNENVEDINLHHLRTNVGLVSQEPVLFNCSILENLLYGITYSVTQLEIDNALHTANAANFVYQFPQGLDTIVGERGTQLSGGQKQRIAIARAIIRNPKVLLLDEATSALDSDSEKIVQNALDNASEKLSTIIIAHRLSTVVNADSIAVLKDGKITEQGTHSELLRLRGTYWKLANKQGTLPSSH